MKNWLRNKLCKDIIEENIKLNKAIKTYKCLENIFKDESGNISIEEKYIVNLDKKPILDPATVFFGGVEHPEWCSEELMLAQLLIDDVIFLNSVHWMFDFYEQTGEKQENGFPKYKLKDGIDKKNDSFCGFVCCNDIFAWACSDGENISNHELRDLYEMHMKNPSWGSAIWCIIKRNQMPQKPVLDDMKQAGVWDLFEMDKRHIGENYQDEQVQQAFRQMTAKDKGSE